MHFLIMSTVFLLSLQVICTEQQPSAVTSVSSVNKLLSVRKRSLLLPNYGSIKLTISLGKAILGNSPKGLSLSWELSSYYAGPTTLKDWFAEPHHRLREMSNKTASKEVRNQMTRHKHQNQISNEHPLYGIIKRSMGDDRNPGSLTSLLGSEIKCSILRSICTSREFLLPPGYSMIQDIVRVVFLMPTSDEGSGGGGSSICDSSTHCELEIGC